MKRKTIKIDDEEFTIYTEKSTTVEVEKPLYDLIAVDEYGYHTWCTTYTVYGDFRLKAILEQIKDDGIEEYTGVSNSDLELLEKCIKLFENKQVDNIVFELGL